MNTPALIVSVAGLACSLASWTSYLAAIPRGKVVARPLGHVLMQCVAMALATAGIGSWFHAGGSAAAVLVPALLVWLLGATFLFLLTQRHTPVGNIAVKVGMMLLPFSSTQSDGTAFRSDTLKGKRVLLKFFRGHW